MYTALTTVFKEPSQFPQELKGLVVDSLPFVSLSRKDDLPESSGIYYAMDSKHRVYYVGKSDNIKKRWNRHEKLDFLKQFDDALIAYFLPDVDSKKLKLIETWAIRQWMPVFNNIKPKYWHEYFAGEVTCGHYLHWTISKNLRLLTQNKELLSFSHDMLDLSKSICFCSPESAQEKASSHYLNRAISFIDTYLVKDNTEPHSTPVIFATMLKEMFEQLQGGNLMRAASESDLDYLHDFRKIVSEKFSTK